VDVDKSEMRGKGLTMPFIQLSQSAPCPSVYGKMVNVRLVWAKVEDVRLNVVVNQRRGTWRPQHRLWRRTVCGSDTVGASQWAAAARERRYSSPRSLDEACGGTKRLSWKKGKASIMAEWRSTSPLGKHFPPWLIATESLQVKLTHATASPECRSFKFLNHHTGQPYK